MSGAPLAHSREVSKSHDDIDCARRNQAYDGPMPETNTHKRSQPDAWRKYMVVFFVEAERVDYVTFRQNELGIGTMSGHTLPAGVVLEDKIAELRRNIPNAEISVRRAEVRS